MVGRYATEYRNTNPLVRNPAWDIDITKTGYLNEAGRCLVMKANIANTPVVLVLMPIREWRQRLAESRGRLNPIGRGQARRRRKSTSGGP